ncbi:MAG: hypothetical protein ACRD68_04480 [Pyrinomonadaceae bacterium]
MTEGISAKRFHADTPSSGSAAPAWARKSGATRKRSYEFSGDRLTLTAPVEAGGERRTRRIIRECVK